MVANQTEWFKAWTEVCHEIFGGWEMKTMWNLQKNVWCVRSQVETHWLSSIENIPSTATSKEGHADSHLGHEKIP